MAASVIGAFAAVEKDLPFAAAAGLSCFEIAAEIAAKGSPGPAFFKQRMLDALFKLDKNSVTRMQKISLA
jgi:hydroxyethylthiazole kinase